MITRTRGTSWIATTLIASVALGYLSAGLAANAATGTAESVKVTVKYTGKGDVDKTHRLWIWLFDTPDIGSGSIPVAELALDQNGGVATFEGVSAAKVWIAVAYDQNGGFAGNAPPPSGSPVAFYTTESGAPAPVIPGAKAEATVTFDDSQRMP